VIKSLEGLRGLAALFVAFYHAWPNSTKALPIVGSGWLWVDLFFVLSGCVIAKGYVGKLTTGASLKNYAVKRFARLYPLHILTLVVWLGLALIMPEIVSVGKKLLGSADHLIQRYDVPEKDLMLNIFMLHGLGLLPDLSLNFPSWSVSVEMAVYLVWAVIWLTCQSTILLGAIGLSLALCCGIFLYGWGGLPNIGYMQDLGFFRCLLGFSLGTIIPMVAKQIPNGAQKMIGNYLSGVCMVLALGMFFSARSYPALTYFSPIIFTSLVLSLYWDEGPIAAALKTSALVKLGALSYSIYLIHGPLLLIFKPLASQFSQTTGNFLLIPYLVLLVLLAHISFKYFEVPSRDAITKKLLNESRLATK
jgi:peptidoglycan/LPS O-acetylase OafA/YrhL